MVASNRYSTSKSWNAARKSAFGGFLLAATYLPKRDASYYFEGRMNHVTDYLNYCIEEVLGCGCLNWSEAMNENRIMKGLRPTLPEIYNLLALMKRNFERSSREAERSRQNASRTMCMTHVCVCQCHFSSS